MNLKKPNANPIPRNKRTQRPLKLNQAEREDPELEEEATCKLNFRIYWDDVKIRWFIPRRQAGCRRHNGHPHIEHPHLCTQPVEAQGKDAKADFLPVFKTVCKFANAAGPEGHRVLEQELNALKDKQLAIIAKKKEATSGKDAYSEYMHLYESVCGYTNDAGEEGRQALMEGLNRLKKKQVDIITEQKVMSTGERLY